MTNKDIILVLYIAFWFIGSIICVIFHLNSVLFQICMLIILCMFVILRANDKFEKWLRTEINSYYLNKYESQLWESISNKVSEGYKEYLNIYDGEFWAPYTKELNKEEIKLLNKIHEKYFGPNWYVVDPLSPNQVHYIMYEDIKKFVRL